MKSTRKFYWFHGRNASWGGLVALAALAAACTSGPAPRPVADGNRQGGADVRVFFASDLHAYLEPCGCQSRPLGGLDRAALVMAEGERGAGGTLRIFAGPTYFNHDEIEPMAVAQERLRAETLAKIFDRLRVDAVAPALPDLVLGPDALKKLAGTKRALLAANVRGAGPTLPETVREVGGVRVGLFGVTELGPTHPTDPPVAAARAAVARLEKAGARVVIGIASLGRRGAAEIAREVAGIDFLLVANADQYPPPPPQKIRETTLLFGGRHGMGIGVLDLWLREDDPRFVDAGDQASRAAIERIDRRVADLETRLTEWQRAKSASAAELAAMRRRLDDLRREREELEHRPPPTSQSSFVSRWEELGPERRQDPAIRALIEGFDARVGELNRHALAAEQVVPPEVGRPTYSGSEACVDCHEAADAFWRTTKHAVAYGTLEENDKHLDLGCVGCHVTGYRRPGGSTALHVGSLKSVQCEACHGPGSAHVDASGADDPTTLVRATPEATCITCHNQEHSDQFNYRTYLGRILGPGHGRPVAQGPAKSR